MANRCAGLPSDPCPRERYDTSVKYGIYDLFLCPACEKTRDEDEAKRKRDEVADKTIKKAKDRRPAVSNASRKIADTRGSKGNADDAPEKEQLMEESRSSSSDRAL